MRRICVCCLLRQVSSPGSEMCWKEPLLCCPAISALQPLQVHIPKCSVQMVLPGNQPQAPAAAKPLPSAGSFTHGKFQQSAGYCSAWEALKMWLRTGTCISNSFSVGKAGVQTVRSCNKPRDLCYVLQDIASGKKMVLAAGISDPCSYKACSVWRKKQKVT